MVEAIDPLPSQAVTSVLATRAANLSRVTAVSALKKALDSDEESTARLLRMMGIGANLNVKA